jgi:hypothetical protein
MTWIQQTALASAVMLGFAACASVPSPTAEMATARAAVENARRAGAGQLSALEMGEAQDLLTRAERAEASRDYILARRTAEQARAAAELAVEKARLAKSAQAKTELDNSIKALRGSGPTSPR